MTLTNVRLLTADPTENHKSRMHIFEAFSHFNFNKPHMLVHREVKQGSSYSHPQRHTNQLLALSSSIKWPK